MKNNYKNNELEMPLTVKCMSKRSSRNIKKALNLNKLATAFSVTCSIKTQKGMENMTKNSITSIYRGKCSSKEITKRNSSSWTRGSIFTT